MTFRLTIPDSDIHTLAAALATYDSLPNPEMIVVLASHPRGDIVFNTWLDFQRSILAESRERGGKAEFFRECDEARRLANVDDDEWARMQATRNGE